MIIKTILVGGLLCLCEAINGNFRVRILHRRFGVRNAKRISLVTGVLLILFVCWLTLPWINPESYVQSILVGAIWFLQLLVLDVYFAKFVFRVKWPKIIDDFNLAKGNLLTLGLLFVLFCPVLVFWLQSNSS
jgi:hypothetical protein